MGAASITVITMLMLARSSVCKLIDLSHDHGPNTLMSPGSNPYQHTLSFSGDFFPGMFVEYGQLASGEHGGTHIDAPRHFSKNGSTLQELPLELTVLDGVMIDCSSDVKGNKSYAMPLNLIHAWEKEHGQIPKGAAVVVNFGWSDRFWNHTLYVDVESTNPSEIRNYRYPSLSVEAGEWLLRERNTRMLVTDSLGPDLASDNFPLHVLFLGNGRTIVENARDPSRLPARGFRLHAAPVKFVNSSGSQIRLYAMTYDEDHGNGQQKCHPTSLVFILACLVSAFIKAHVL